MFSTESSLAPMTGAVVAKGADAGYPGVPDGLPEFARRHIGPTDAEMAQMLQSLGYPSLDALTDATVPAGIRLRGPLRLPAPVTEFEALQRLRAMAGKNRVARSYLGMGYYDCITPPVILRNLLENPGWYTQYTPYQAEISQGRLEGLLHFQTMVCDLTGMEIANASLLDEATAAAEGMIMALALKGTDTRRRFLVADHVFPQTLAVLRTRAEPLGVEVVVGKLESTPVDGSFFGVLSQTPDVDGALRDVSALAAAVHGAGALLIVATDLLALTLFSPPGEMGADIVVGSAQRFGVPLGYGGPHAAFFATRDALKRQMPGRLVGVSKDSRGKPGLRLTLQTREQHIRREKATSNICTAQALLANMAVMYAIYHGPEGLTRMARRIHEQARHLVRELTRYGYAGPTDPYFDTVRITGSDSGQITRVVAAARARQINLRQTTADAVVIALDETVTGHDLAELADVFAKEAGAAAQVTGRDAGSDQAVWPAGLVRRSAFLTHAVFHRYHSETEMMRYLKRLEARDLSLTASMIPLGSCTMKLNAAAEMIPISWVEFARLHPFAPRDQAAGYQELFDELERWLAEITGFAAVSLQPNAGSQGEYAGLLVIRRYHESCGESQRKVCLIPTSAHGTNPASAVMAGMRVVPVACDASGNIDVSDLRQKADTCAGELGALMVTYPSTHGVFEETIRDICALVHERGGQVYMDGANLNAQVGLCRPGDVGADVCHLNLHKTFCIPHGGGGPGMGPVAVAAHLATFLPRHPLVAVGGATGIGPVSAAPWGSASILPISWVYIALMGAVGLRRATQVAILNANYVAHRLEPYFPILYRGTSGRVAHECILDLRPFKSVTVEDVAKRLMDYGFHAPTISWPVSGTMMVEPTESESLAELDRFCEAMISIHAEIQAVESGKVDRIDNVLKQAPHTADMVAGDEWRHAYSRQQAAFPVPSLLGAKYWPPVGRIDNVYGDRNPVCTCVGMEAFGVF